MNKLENRHCSPPESSHPLPEIQEKKLLEYIPHWKLITTNSHHIERQFEFGGFEEAVAFFNKVAAIARMENHHPDICVAYNKVTIKLTTHKIKGLHENDFIMAAKINRLL